MPRRNDSANHSPRAYDSTSTSGALAAITRVAVAIGVLRSSPDRASAAPTSEWVRLSIEGVAAPDQFPTAGVVGEASDGGIGLITILLGPNSGTRMRLRLASYPMSAGVSACACSNSFSVRPWAVTK